MTNVIYTPREISERLSGVFDSYNVNKAILFGSYAKGFAGKQSDVDIYVDSGLRGLDFFGLLEDVTESLDKKIDLIDSTQVKHNSPIAREIMESGLVIYER